MQGLATHPACTLPTPTTTQGAPHTAFTHTAYTHYHFAAWRVKDILYCHVQIFTGPARAHAAARSSPGIHCTAPHHLPPHRPFAHCTHTRFRAYHGRPSLCQHALAWTGRFLRCRVTCAALPLPSRLQKTLAIPRLTVVVIPATPHTPVTGCSTEPYTGGVTTTRMPLRAGAAHTQVARVRTPRNRAAERRADVTGHAHHAPRTAAGIHRAPPPPPTFLCRTLYGADHDYIPPRFSFLTLWDGVRRSPPAALYSNAAARIYQHRWEIIGGGH